MKTGDDTAGTARTRAAQRVIAARLATYDAARAARTRTHGRAAHIRAAERLGQALAASGHCPYEQTERLRRHGTTDPIEIARRVAQEQR